MALSEVLGSVHSEGEGEGESEGEDGTEVERVHFVSKTDFSFRAQVSSCASFVYPIYIVHVAYCRSTQLKLIILDFKKISTQ